MSDLDRFSLIAAEETDAKNACPKCGKQMTESRLGRTINLWYCDACEVFRPKENKYGSKGRQKDPEI